MATQEQTRWTGRAAVAAAAVGVVLAPLHALSRYATEDGKADLQSGAVRAWADPATDALQPLLAWSDPDAVYLTYGKVWLFVFAAVTATAFLVRRTRAPRGVESWGWRIALTGYVVATVSLFGTYWTPWLEEAFLLMSVPGMLISLVGSTVLGIALLRHGFRPRATACLLALWVPLMVLLSSVIALGAAAMPMVLAWGIAGRWLAQETAAPVLHEATART